MAMISFNTFIFYITTIFVTLLPLLAQVSCLDQNHPFDTTQALLFEEKARLGSTPPSCHNKCNQCHPCMAVQVSTLPSHNQLQPGSSRPVPKDYYDSPSGNQYSNYKPLGWKCRCNDHFYNP